MLLRPALVASTTLVAAAAVLLVVEVSGLRVTESRSRDVVVLALTLGAAAAGAGVALLARRRPAVAADAGVVAAGVLLAAMGATALHGTRWGWSGLFADSAFRTQMATRYADTASLVDYGYRGLPAYYPPALGWLEGRVASLTGLAGWEAVKPVQLVLAALVPLAAYALWRPVAGALPAAAVAALTTVWTAHPQKPDEWLVLACLLPWWLLTVRDVRAPDVERWSVWRLGLVLGLLLLTHTYWFMPLGVATVLALAVDAVHSRRGGRTRLPWRRALAIGAIGLAVSAVSWLPLVLARLRLPSDSLQMRYAVPDGHVPPWPVPTDPLGVVGLAGVLWLAWAGWRWVRGRGGDDLAGGLALALAGALATLGLGALAASQDIGILAFKTRDAVVLLLLVSGVLGVGHALRAVASAAPRRVTGAVAAGLVAVAAGTAGHHVADEWSTGSPALVAQTTRYPDGSMPSGDPVREPWIPTLFVEPTDPSVEEVRAAWRALRPDVPLDEAVLVTTQVDLLATTPVHWFVATKSIYSHPNGRFEDRVALLEQVGACPTSACAADLLRDNDLDEVDGLVLQRDGDRLVLPFTVDTFPDRTRRSGVAFPDEVLRGPEFERREMGRIVVVALTGRP
ncbi:MAG TPA: arabinofuranosyltransferase [Nocardioides sp.]|nr:arabinofuranosyltransferase [Nocardioides sp.]